MEASLRFCALQADHAHLDRTEKNGTPFIFTYLIALGDFTHVIAGATEVFLLIFSGNLPVYDGVVLLLLLTLAGNIIGGTGLFALLADAQVRDQV